MVKEKKEGKAVPYRYLVMKRECLEDVARLRRDSFRGRNEVSLFGLWPEEHWAVER